MRITHRITIGTEKQTPPDSSRLASLRVRAMLRAPVKYADMTFAPAQGLTISVDDDLKVELGVDGKSSQVFSGKVVRVEWFLEKVRVLAESRINRMTATRVNMAFEKQAAGDIVSALCKESGVRTGKIDPGLKFPAYAVSAAQSVYDHARRLASQCGFDLYPDPEDNIVFARPVPSGAPRILQYGTTVLSVSVEKPHAVLGKVTVFGESPASLGKGDDAAPWLTKKDVKGDAPALGSGNIALQDVEPAVKTLQDAQQMAKNLQTARSAKSQARVQIVGTPECRLNETVQLSRMPNDALNGTFRIIGVEHQLQHSTGFLTMLELEMM